MHVTLHITTGCNMSCDYCYSPPNGRNDMSRDTAYRTIDFIAENYPVNTGIIFFGGEPLLKRDLIIDTINYSQEKSSNSSRVFCGDTLSKEEQSKDKLIEELYKQIGQLKVDNDWLKKKLL